jgi:CHAT domain-containing protein
MPPSITWCPTGPLVFLPLHAAGIYSKHGASECIMDFAISSYTPTLGALLKPALNTDPSGKNPTVLIVSQPDTPGQSPIPGTEKEAVLILSKFPKSSIVLSRNEGTVAAVLEGMETHNWVHFACHGLQDPIDPTKSAFLLYDGKLTLSSLMSQSFHHAELAFLSACQTASGEEELPEEAIHLAAGMLSVGYKSIIGTMWSIKDSHAAMVAEKFYEAMKKQLTDRGKLQPAYTLHEAMRSLRENIGVDRFLEWIPFVHFGI